VRALHTKVIGDLHWILYHNQTRTTNVNLSDVNDK